MITKLKLATLSKSLLIGSLLAAFSANTLAHDHGNKALQSIIEARPAEMQARDQYRNPQETLDFFEVKPGMTVAEALPGGGWYSGILADYLGKDGALYGINYVDSMWARFGFFSEERITEMKAATKAFPGLVAELSDSGIAVEGYTFETIPEALDGTVDRVLFIRALHNLNRFESQAGTLTQALKATYNMLKSDGLVGVVQHAVAESDADNDGSRGYLKASQVQAAFEAAGFELVASSDINKNPKDEPTASDIVWRLPPSYVGVGDDADKKKAADAIGESNRMTLLFKKKS
ncbi:class I SAM-dependent methyltransferase [Planctobacterium marinum]|uniref:Methyltransferase n=1 Tax=Planctobacterium marinum TaxID=1631968 RepID=A0AA48HS02_9ALTE|nr:methyltransferase [Planctobacterium marinum]